MKWDSIRGLPANMVHGGMLAVTTLIWVMPVLGNEPLAGRRPNIVFVITDDQGKGDLSCLGNPDLKTPHLDELYRVSTRFRDFHVSPTCAPTRSALMSGRHPMKNGVTHTIIERERMALDTVTVAEMLKEAGYATGIFGKWHLGDEAPYQPGERGFDEVFIHGGGGIGQKYDCSCADAPPNQENRYFDCVIRQNGTFVKTEGFCTDVFFRAALDWIDQQRSKPGPFFAYISTNAPHDPMIAPESYKQPFLDVGFDEYTAARYGMIANIDDNMGLLRDKLHEWQLDPDTLLIFMTDNGQAVTRGKRQGETYSLHHAGLRDRKGSVHEGGTRVPFFCYWDDNLPAGVDVDALAAHIDVFPTLAAVAAGNVPEQQVEGRSLLPLLENPTAEWEDRLLFVHRGRWPKDADPDDYQHQNCAVRSPRFRLINHQQLFDIVADPGETTDVAADHPEEVARLQRAFDQWWVDTRPLMVNEGVPNASSAPFWDDYQRQLETEGIPHWQPQ